MGLAASRSWGALVALSSRNLRALTRTRLVEGGEGLVVAFNGALEAAAEPGEMVVPWC